MNIPETVGDLYQLVKELRIIGSFCANISRAIYKRVSGNIGEEIYPDEPSHPEPVITAIEEQLAFGSVCMVWLTNGTGNSDETFEHHFTLFQIEQQIFRVEGYAKLYCARLVEWPTWKQDFLRLLTINPGVERVAYWNGLFSAKETKDTQSPTLEVIINFNSL
jgi:hypothetical protein